MEMVYSHKFQKLHFLSLAFMFGKHSFKDSKGLKDSFCEHLNFFLSSCLPFSGGPGGRHVVVWRHLAAVVALFLPGGFQELNSGHQARQQVPLSPELSSRPYYNIFWSNSFLTHLKIFTS